MVEVRKFSAPMVSLERCMTRLQVKKVKADGADRSSLTGWRQRLGEELIAALLQESLSVAHRSGAIQTKDLERVVVDTTVQEKAIAATEILRC
jgi:hypothetical protein